MTAQVYSFDHSTLDVVVMSVALLVGSMAGGVLAGRMDRRVTLPTQEDDVPSVQGGFDVMERSTSS